jgi:hypothetical protein
MSGVDCSVVCDKYVGHVGVIIMRYFDAVSCLLWIFIYKLHNFCSWSSTNIYTACIYSQVYDKLYSSYIWTISIKTLFIHPRPPRYVHIWSWSPYEHWKLRFKYNDFCIFLIGLYWLTRGMSSCCIFFCKRYRSYRMIFPTSGVIHKRYRKRYKEKHQFKNTTNDIRFQFMFRTNTFSGQSTSSK